MCVVWLFLLRYFHIVPLFIKLNNIIININLIYLFLYIFTTSSSIDQLNQLAEFYFLKETPLCVSAHLNETQLCFI